MQLEPKKVSYQGLFLDEKSVGRLVDYINSKGDQILVNRTKNPHITFKFGPKRLFDDKVRQSEYKVRVVGYANDGMNQGFKVELPRELALLYEGSAVAHITFAIGPGGRAVHTGGLAFNKIPPFTVSGYLGFCLNKTFEIVY